MSRNKGLFVTATTLALGILGVASAVASAALIQFAVVHGLLLDAWPRDSKVASINIHAQSGLLVTQPRRCGTISSAATRCCCECCRVPGNSNQ